MDITEQGLLAAIRRLLDEPAGEIVVGVGDDAAVVRPGSGDLVFTTDALVQDRHFRLDATSPRDLGAKAIAVAVSDVAAVAGSPRFVLSALTLSDRVDAAWSMELFGGMREVCLEHGAFLVGGNLSRGNEVGVVVTVLGEVAPGRAVTRAGAGPGDHLVVTGALGGAAAGLRFSARRGRRGRWTDDELAAIRRQVRPVARVGEAGVLARHGATAMIDLSDGLSSDLTRLCSASGVGARVHLDAVPVAAGATLAEALGGGEDYELLATLPAAAEAEARDEMAETFGVALTRVGDIVDPAVGVVAAGEGGEETPLVPAGWDHFAGA